MCILCGDYVDLFECPLDFHKREFKFCFRAFINGMCVVALEPATIIVWVRCENNHPQLC